MATKQRFDQLRKQLDKLRRDSLDMATSANKIVSKGVQKIADHELKSLSSTYQDTIKSLKKASKSGGVKGVASSQLDVLQETANRLIDSARGAMRIVDETRNELTKLAKKGSDTTAKDLKKVVDPVKKELTDLKKKATAAAKKTTKSAKKSAPVKKAKTATKKATTTAKKATKKVTAKAKATTQNVSSKKPSATLRPSPNSRANRATSRAKKRAGASSSSS